MTKDPLERMFGALVATLRARNPQYIEQGFEVAMVRDATAGTTNEEGDGYRAALVNFRFMAHALWTTREAVGRMAEASARP